jgi:hypothetical protein
MVILVAQKRGQERKNRLRGVPATAALLAAGPAGHPVAASANQPGPAGGGSERLLNSRTVTPLTGDVVQRRVQALMTAAHARTRMQLAWHAGLSRWL